jgi:hypothetical protein
MSASSSRNTIFSAGRAKRVKNWLTQRKEGAGGGGAAAVLAHCRGLAATPRGEHRYRYSSEIFFIRRRIAIFTRHDA